ncbi:MAG TPA: CAP domain-containing protein [Phycisphaerae bacterium]|nr:CAP domain-containing protein [Phycisphaerae bacterium]HRR86360.1 CAP domain-containing protein [Phycisphaerae bacterium]
MRREWQYSVSALAALVFAALVGCSGGVLPSGPAGTGAQEVFNLLRLDGDVADTSGSLAAEEPCLELGAPDTAVQKRLFAELNNYRVNHGLSPLVYSKRLEAAAQAHLSDMYERGYFAHITPEGLEPGDRAMELGFCHRYVGENLAAGQRTVQAVMRAWDNSPSHQLNMLEPDYVYVGLGHFVDPITGRQYWAQEFAYHVVE